jgi:hypothetical protein
MIETWKNIIGFDGEYQVSNLGRIKSLKKNKLEKLLSQCNHTNGYKYVSLSKNGVAKHYYVHRLVAESFLLNSDNKLEVNHIDGDKTNNHVENLQWVTRQENVKHEFDNGYGYVPNLKGENHGSSKLKESQVINIYIAYHKDNIRISDLSKKYNISESAIDSIVKNRNWKHITCNLI